MIKDFEMRKEQWMKEYLFYIHFDTLMYFTVWYDATI